MKSFNPATGKILNEYPEHSPQEVSSIIEKNHRAFLLWREESFATRRSLMNRAAEILRRNKEKYARLMSLEMGKIIKESRAEIEKCAWVCEYYAEKAESFLQDELVETDAGKSFVAFNPIGAVLAVMPWNFPFWQVFRFAAPALMAGNVGLL